MSDNGVVKDKTVLIFGAGLIGEMAAVKVLKEKPTKIVLHTLTEQESLVALENVRKFINDSKIELIPSWGDALVPKELMYSSKKKLFNDKQNMTLLLDYYYSCLTDQLLEKSSLYYLIGKYKPKIVIDVINTATVIGYKDDPYSLPRKILKNVESFMEDENWKQRCLGLLATSIVPALVRFTQALEKAMKDFEVESYVKVSTTGLGGMGVNLLYTHGDLNEPGMSSGILGKVAAAGVIHQLLWSLSHTPGLNIKVVVPAALVGWQPVQFGKFRSHGKNISLEDVKDKTKLKNGEVFKVGETKKLKEFMEIPYVDSGENSAYSLGEMTAITALGQMGCVTREEIAEAVLGAIKGSTRHDLLTAMDNIVLGPSFPAAIQRISVLDQIQSLAKEKNIPSIATNNLGPTVSKHLFELYIILKVSNDSIKECIETDSEKLAKKAQDFIEANQEVRAQAISLGLPIIFENDEMLIGKYFLVPNIAETNCISEENINKWATAGWVDLREEQMNYWKFWLSETLKDALKIKQNNNVALDRNWHKIEKTDIGEILGYIYSLRGGERRTEF